MVKKVKEFTCEAVEECRRHHIACERHHKEMTEAIETINETHERMIDTHKQVVENKENIKKVLTAAECLQELRHLGTIAEAVGEVKGKLLTAAVDKNVISVAASDKILASQASASTTALFTQAKVLGVVIFALLILLVYHMSDGHINLTGIFK